MSGFVAPISELLGDESFEDYYYWAAGALFILMAGNAPLGTWQLQRPLAAEAGIAGRRPQPAPKTSPPPVSLGQNLRPARSRPAVPTKPVVAAAGRPAICKPVLRTL
jgi:cytochrome oxidase assembly protein ShyY1